MYARTVLPSGIRILTVPMPQTRSVTLLLFLGAGSRYEETNQSGISHFIEHMAFKGTTKRPSAREISEAIEGIGGVMNASTGVELTGYWVRVARHHFSVAADVLADMLEDPLFDRQELEKERRVILEEIRMVYDIPSSWVHVLFTRAMWPDHSVGQDIAGTRETVQGIAREDLLSYREALYHPNNLVVAVAGKVEHDAVADSIAGILGNWNAERAPTAYPPARSWDGKPKLVVEHRATEQTSLCLGVRALSRRDHDRFKLQVLNTILGEGMSSRLFQEIREVRGLAYDVSSHISLLSDTGALVISAGVSPESAPMAVTATLGELDRLRNELIPEDALFRAKEFIKGRLLLSMEETSSNAAWVGRQEILDGQVLSLDEVISEIEAVQAPDIQDTARRLFRTEALLLAVVGPNEEEDFEGRLAL